MGNSNSRQPWPSFQIIPDKELYHPGDKLCGKVVMEVFEEGGLQASSLELEVVGEEGRLAKIITHTTRFGQKKHTRKNYDVNTLCHMETSLAKFPSKNVPKGKTEYPFAVQLPSSGLLPSNLGNPSSIQVGYHITVRLKHPSGKPEKDCESSINFPLQF